MLKPIEEGCLALIIKSVVGNSGVVRVGRFLGCTYHDYGDDNWEVDKPMKYRLENGYIGVDFINQGKNMMRIDGGEFEDERETEKVLVGEK